MPDTQLTLGVSQLEVFHLVQEARLFSLAQASTNLAGIGSKCAPCFQLVPTSLLYKYKLLTPVVLTHSHQMLLIQKQTQGKPGFTLT